MGQSSQGKAFKAGIWYTFANFVTKGAVFLTTPLFTRLMTKQDIGAYSNITSWLAILTIIASFEFATSLNVARFDFKDELDEYISSTLVYGSLITLIFYSVVLLNKEFFCEFFAIPEYALHLIFLYICFYPAILMYQYKCRFIYNYVGVLVTSLGALVISISAALLCTFNFEDKLFGRTIGYFVGNIVAYIVIYFYLLYKGRRVSFKYLKYALTLSFPMIWHALSGQILNAGDRIIITRYVGTEANAMYSIAYTCGMIVYVLWNSMNSAWAPWAMERMDSNEISDMKKATVPYLVFFAFVSTISVLIAPEFLYIIGGKDYVEAKYVFPPIIAGYVCQCVYSLYVNCEFYYKKQNRIALGTMISAGLNLVLNVIFVPKFGYSAAAYTTWFGFFCMVLFHYLSVRQLNKSNWYNNRFQWSVVVYGGILVPIAIIAYKYTIIRVVIIAILAVSLIVLIVRYRTVILRMINKLMPKRGTDK